jgi:hypothetical protein
VDDGPYDGAVLHQNVMLELINESGVDATWRALRSVLHPGAMVLFDYPNDLHLPCPGAVVSLVQQTIPDVGRVQYTYKYLGRNGAQHRIEIRFSIVREDGFRKSRSCTLEAVIPASHEVLEIGKSFGFKAEGAIDFDSYTFFPSRLAIYQARMC